MSFSLRDLPVYLLIAAFVVGLVSLIIVSRKQEREEKEKQKPQSGLGSKPEKK